MNKIPDTSFDGNSVESSNQNNNLNESTESESSEANITLFGCDSNIKKSELRTLSLLSIYFFLIYCYFSLLTPFFPGVAKSKGMNQIEVGCIFAIYQFVQIIISHLFGKQIEKLGTKFLFVFGMFLCSTSEILFGLLVYLPDGYPFFFTCLVCRGITAIGSSMSMSYAIVGHFFPRKMSTIVGVLEIFSGFGLMAGPIIGGLLFQTGGFRLPFFVVGGIQFLLFIAAWLFFPKTETLELVEKSEAYSVCTLLKNVKFSLTLLFLFCGAISINFIEPSIQLHLLPLELSPFQLGLVFFIPAFIYVLVTPLIGFLCRKMPKSMPWIMIISTILAICSYSLLGPLPSLRLPLKLSIFLLGYGLFSVSFGCLIIPVYSELLVNACIVGYPNDLRTQSLISGLFSLVYSLGAMIGPVTGGVVYDYMGFDMATFFIVVMFIVIGTVYTIYHVIDQFILGNYWTRIRSTNPPADSEEAPLITNRAN